MHLHLQNFVGHDIAFFVIRLATHHLYFIAYRVGGKYALLYLIPIFLNQAVSHIEDILCRAIVLLLLKRL